MPPPMMIMMIKLTKNHDSKAMTQSKANAPPGTSDSFQFSTERPFQVLTLMRHTQIQGQMIMIMIILA